jgi:hypothetical protein
VEYLASYRRWIGVARLTYNLAIIALLVAVAVMLMPKGSVDVWRAVGVGLAALGALAEIVWAFVATGPRRRKRVRYSSSPEDVVGLVTPRLRPDADREPARQQSDEAPRQRRSDG